MTDRVKNSLGDLVSALKEALTEVGRDRRFGTGSARTLRLVLAKRRAEPLALAGRDPEELMGRFEDLPPQGQAALVAAIENDESWRLRGHTLGNWHVRLVRWLRSRTIRRAAGRLGQLAALALQVGPSRGIYALHRAVLTYTWKHAAWPTLDSFLRGAGIEPWRLSICYARPLSQSPQYRGFWHDPNRNFTVGSMLGIDFISAPEGCWFVEANLDAGLENDRTRLYERDPFVCNLFRSARDGGYRQLVIMAGNSSIEDLMAQQCEEMSRALGIPVRIVEDAFRPSRFEYSCGIPEIKARDTLVVRINYYRSNLDHLFQHKAASYRALQRYKEQTGDPDLLLPPTSLDPAVADYAPQEAFPNVVFKFPERDHGKGVFFLKASSPEHARLLAAESVRNIQHPDLTSRLYAAIDDHTALFQRYVPSHLLEGRRLYKVRAHVLVTPTGSRFLSSHRVVSTYPVPETLPIGVVRDPAPYVVNFHTGARYHLIPSEEEERVAKATLAVARGLSAAVVHGYRTSYESSDAVQSNND